MCTTRLVQVKLQCAPDILVFAECRPLLFAKDFQKHLKAIDMLQGELSSNQQAVMASLDLLLR